MTIYNGVSSYSEGSLGDTSNGTKYDANGNVVSFSDQASMNYPKLALTGTFSGSIGPSFHPAPGSPALPHSDHDYFAIDLVDGIRDYVGSAPQGSILRFTVSTNVPGGLDIQYRQTTQAHNDSFGPVGQNTFYRTSVDGSFRDMQLAVGAGSEILELEVGATNGLDVQGSYTITVSVVGGGTSPPPPPSPPPPSPPPSPPPPPPPPPPPSDTTPPTLTGSSPADNATGVAVNSDIQLFFSEAVQRGSGFFEIHKGDGTLVSTISVNDTSQVALNNNIVTINPAANLAGGTSYYILASSNAIHDATGNFFGGISSAGQVNFSTVDVPVVSVAQGSHQAFEGENGNAPSIFFTLQLSSASNTPVTVHYATQDNTAHAGIDFNATSGTATFAPGVTSVIVNVQIIGNANADGDRSFDLVLSSPNGATLPGNVVSQPYTATILDDDPPSKLPTNTPAAGQWTADSTGQVDGEHNSFSSPTFTRDLATGAYRVGQQIVADNLNDLNNDLKDQYVNAAYYWADKFVKKHNLQNAYNLAKDILKEAKDVQDSFKAIKQALLHPINTIVDGLDKLADGTLDPNKFDTDTKNSIDQMHQELDKEYDDHHATHTDLDDQVKQQIDDGMDTSTFQITETDDASSAPSGFAALAATGVTDTASAPTPSSLKFAIVYDDHEVTPALLGSATQVNKIFGSANADNFTGGTLADLLYGGAGNDALLGAEGNDMLIGGDGNDNINGGSGADKMWGNAGNDNFTVDDPNDQVNELPNNGTDRVTSSVSYTLPANVEELTLSGVQNLIGTGNGDANIILGNSGNNTLNGLGGGDTMKGGAGDDSYIVDSINDIIVENPNEGSDTVYAFVSWTLGPNVEFLVMQGNADLQGYGNTLANVIYGNAGSNILDGGAGGDAMYGGAGNDFYFVDTASDGVIENPNEGTDMVLSTASITLGANLENLTLQGNADLQGYGNALANAMFGNAGNNILDGAGGVDSMSGGAGNDSYYVDNISDVVGENVNEGTDTIYSLVNLTLPANVEVLVMQANTNIQGYGNALANTILGNIGSNVLDGGAGADTLSGGGGDDFYYVDNVNDSVVEAANQGNDTVYSTVTYTLTPNFENLVLLGTGDLQGYGNALANVIYGNTGSNVLNGNAGADTMYGGAGNDFYTVDDISDIVVENLNEGGDTVFSTVSYTIGPNVENLVLQGTADLQGYGNALANQIFGNSGSNVLNGNAGGDTMSGGDGNDFYFVDNINDIVSESANQGADTVYSTVTYTLGANVEYLVLQGGADLQGYGNALANVINGNTGNNILDGGAGVDTMYGGAGNDFYYVDNSGDIPVENVGEGSDTVFATANFTLGANIETLILQGAANLQGFGNALANAIYGNTGNNVLDGGGGADTMYGGLGDDTYTVDNPGDLPIENPGEGTDTVLASVGYVLAANLENLTLTGTAGIAGTGNALVNVITGNTGANTLDGSAGGDTMAGGLGDDSYFVDNVNDIVIEKVGEGSDTVYATISYTLPVNVEFMVLQGTADLQAYGNAIANVIYGNTGSNILDGGSGGDTLYGGAGNDFYYVDNTGDIVVENSNEGSDTVFATANFTLGANVEYLVMQGGADLQGFGNGLANVMYGNTGNNILDGGTGGDVMYGGAGNDTYFVDNAGDTVSENPGEGTDTVMASISMTLGANFENLTLTGTGDINATGNGVSNTLTGNSGNNILDGGAGGDAMSGGGGNDAYIVDDINDVVTEGAGQGADTIYSSVNLTMSANVDFLVLQGSADLQGYGNTLANAIYGNSGANILDGGAGGDAMYGGAGNDFYYADNISDLIIENPGEGNDTVYASVNLALSANVETLILQGTADLQGYGGTGANTIFGNSGNNLLDGGAGADTLQGFGGNDVFVFRAGEANGDTIVDFNGNGGGAGDSMQFVGYGAGASFTQMDAAHWQVNYNANTQHEVITFNNLAAIHANDFTFV